jgi:hypothetical protein
MAHYSEMDFLFSNPDNNKSLIAQLQNQGNTFNIFKNPTDFTRPGYIVHKGAFGTNQIKDNLEKQIYNHGNKNPYIKLLDDFNGINTSKALKLKASDLVYLKDLGVYPINRMAILRRFPEGAFVYEKLDGMKIEPISTIVGWIEPDKNFGKIGFNETWEKTTDRFDTVMAKIIKDTLGLGKALFPIPDFAQGILFEFYKKLNLNKTSGVNDSVDEAYSGVITNDTKNIDDTTAWGLNNIPAGDPNLLLEGPFRNPETQNIQSSFSFELITTYEQKLIGDVDPGIAMLDILDNIYAMGTSNMKFFFGDNSPGIQAAKKAAQGNANDLKNWEIFLSEILKSFWAVIQDFFTTIKTTIQNNYNNATANKNTNAASIQEAAAASKKKILDESLTIIDQILTTLLASTVSIHRFKLRGSIELMVGGSISSTPWYLTLGNPYSPWLATNHIVVKSASVETSNEMGFNDQPQRLTATFTCEFSRALGKQELMRMFNNTYRRTYSVPPAVGDTSQKTTIESLQPKQANIKTQNGVQKTQLMTMTNSKSNVTNTNDPR